MCPPRWAHTAARTRANMDTALAVLLLVAGVAAEAPYHLPRPSGHAPAFHLPAPQPRPPPTPPPPPHFAPQPQPFGYQYQQPSFAPTFVQQAPQQHFPVQYPQPAPAYFPPASAPQPLPVSYPQPQPVPFPQPNPSYGLPHPAHHVGQPAPPAPPAPIYHHPIAAPQPAPQLAPQPLPQPQPQHHQIYEQHQSHFQAQQGYNYQQPQQQPRYNQQIPLQAQPLSNHISTSALSSYQADSHQYSGAQEQTHRDALDSVVVGRVQNIIKEDEHSSARNAGFLSLVSGVSLENAKPSVELSSFVQTSPLATGFSLGQASSHGSGVASSGPSASYGLPSVSANTHSSSSGSFSSGYFLPQSKPASSYGPPN